jgi:hypothetical protein
MYSEAGLTRTARDFDLWNPGSIPVDAVLATLDTINTQRPEGKPPVGAIYRLAQQSTAGKRLSVDDMTTRVQECVTANLDGVVVETNFCSEITSPQAWVRVLANLKPLVDTAENGQVRPGGA